MREIGSASHPNAEAERSFSTATAPDLSPACLPLKSSDHRQGRRDALYTRHECPITPRCKEQSNDNDHPCLDPECEWLFRD